jgi:4-hydroxybenzoate polyprenyltransferase
VDNNLFALLAVGAIALLASLVFAWKDRTLANRKARKSFLWGFGVASGLWLVILFARVASLQWVIKNFHWIAAVLLFICIFVVAIANARRVKDESHDRAKDQSSAQPSSAQPSSAQPSSAQPSSAQPSSAQPSSAQPSSAQPSSAQPVKQSMEAAGDLIGVGKRGDRYIWFARVMLLGAVVTLVLWRLTDLTLFWVEVSVFLLFIAFWTAQTIELDPRQKTVLEPPKTADQS